MKKARVSRKREDIDADYAVYQKIKSEYELLLQDIKILCSDEGSTAERIRQAIDFMKGGWSLSTINGKGQLLHALFLQA
jgi:hypothetical protein